MLGIDGNIVSLGITVNQLTLCVTCNMLTLGVVMAEGLTPGVAVSELKYPLTTDIGEVLLTDGGSFYLVWRT